ncbi:MAG TPA: MarR family transcriptional regulator [Candidatus Limnocylindrales bacterium]
MVSQADTSAEILRLLPAVAVDLRLASLFDLEGMDLTANQVLTLTLVSSAEGGRLKAGEIASRLYISFPAASALVDRLVTAGVFERSQGADRRVVWVSLTEAGQGLTSRLRTGLSSRIDIALGNMDPGEQAKLVEALRSVASLAKRIGDIEAPRAAAPVPDELGP